MRRGFWPRILVIDAPTWDDRHNLAFSSLLVLKIASLLGVVIAFAKVMAAIISGHLRPLNAVQMGMLILLFFVHIRSQSLASVRRGGQFLLFSMTAGLLIGIVASTHPYYSGAHHYISGTLLLAGFLLGIRYVLVVLAVFIALYGSYALGLWNQEPMPINLLVDRTLELLIVCLFVGLYHRLKERQYKIIAEQERANVQKEKLIAINRMAGGIAHEINNPLAIVMGYVEIMSTQDQQKPVDRRVLSRITAACERIASIVDSILKLTKDGGNSLEEIDLLESCRLICQEIGGQSNLNRVQWQLAVEPLHFQIPAGYWDLILSSILKNAFEAASVQSLPEVHISSETRGNILMLTIADNGPTFDESQIPNFFEPFYTSKSEMPGRGMGLSIAYVLVTRLGWAIDMRREARWTRVQLKMMIPGLASTQTA